jgi:hypothetical protein
MLYLEIQRDKTEMPKWSAMYRELGATSSCSVRAEKEMANGGQRKTEHLRNCILEDSCFASVKTAEAIHECCHEWIGIVKTSHSLFPKEELEEKMKTWPGGMNLAMEATTSKGVKLLLLAIGYKYNSSKVLCFVATKNAGSTMLGDPYRARFADDYDNLWSRLVDRPQIISTYFQKSNAIDKHNQARQFELKLEKHWRTQNAWFRLVTTSIGICVTDAWKGYRHASLHSKKDEELSIYEFADRLAYELIHNNFDGDNSVTKTLSPLFKKTPTPTTRRSPRKYDVIVRINPEVSETSMTPLTSTATNSAKVKQAQAEAVWLQVLDLHKHVQQQATEASERKIRRHCAFCKNKTVWYCSTCNIYCCPEITNPKEPRNCFKDHVLKVHL